MSEQQRNEDRLNDLLADRAVFGLDADEAEELSKLISLTDKGDDDSFEIAAAAVDLSMNKAEPMPADLSKKLSELGHRAMENDRAMETEQAASKKTATVEPSHQVIHAGETNSDLRSASTAKLREIVAWGCAAAIGFVALMVWTNNRSDLKQLETQVADLKAENIELSTSNSQLEVSVKEFRKQMFPDGKEIYERLASNQENLQWNWSATGETEGSGDIVWDEEKQEGVMRLVNLEVNDPEVSQYQLWIIEEGRRQHPVDGGVFDIKEKGEIFVPVNSKLYAKNAVTFAITVEKPGGVVVSNKENLPYVATAPKAAQ